MPTRLLALACLTPLIRYHDYKLIWSWANPQQCMYIFKQFTLFFAIVMFVSEHVTSQFHMDRLPPKVFHISFLLAEASMFW